MRNFYRRLAAYLLTGMSVGIAGWLAICPPAFVGGSLLRWVVAALLVFGLSLATVLLRKPHARATGQGVIVSPGQVLASDLVSLAAAAVSGFFVVDGFSERLFGLRACVTDPLAGDIIAVLFLPVAAVLALFVTQTGDQRIIVDEAGLTVDGFNGSVHADWDDIVGFRPEPQHVLVGRAGLLVPRHLRTNIVVLLREGAGPRLFDPVAPSGRRGVLQALRDALPDNRRQLLEPIEQAWQ